MSEQAFLTLPAVQDDNLSWLEAIPIEMITNSEHLWLRVELNKYTGQLACGGAIDTLTATLRTLRRQVYD